MLVKDILFVLNNSKIVKKVISVDFDGVGEYYRLKIRAELTNSQTLQIWEHRTPSVRRYAYHVFKNSSTIVRWDNAPHHPNIKIFPHHKHVENKIEESSEMDIVQVLKKLENII